MQGDWWKSNTGGALPGKLLPGQPDCQVNRINIVKLLAIVKVWFHWQASVDNQKWQKYKLSFRYAFRYDIFFSQASSSTIFPKSLGFPVDRSCSSSCYIHLYIFVILTIRLFSLLSKGKVVQLLSSSSVWQSIIPEAPGGLCIIPFRNINAGCWDDFIKIIF